MNSDDDSTRDDILEALDDVREAFRNIAVSTNAVLDCVNDWQDLAERYARASADLAAMINAMNAPDMTNRFERECRKIEDLVEDKFYKISVKGLVKLDLRYSGILILTAASYENFRIFCKEIKSKITGLREISPDEIETLFNKYRAVVRQEEEGLEVLKIVKFSEVFAQSYMAIKEKHEVYRKQYTDQQIEELFLYAITTEFAEFVDDIEERKDLNEEQYEKLSLKRSKFEIPDSQRKYFQDVNEILKAAKERLNKPSTTLKADEVMQVNATKEQVER